MSRDRDNAPQSSSLTQTLRAIYEPLTTLLQHGLHKEATILPHVRIPVQRVWIMKEAQFLIIEPS
ncbi:MAG: hypothetical protein AUH96_11800 [Nitrospirae bacterium 13_2_20CM_2_61_4]|nr:MAG: hypothetical protein AUH96_11800 [Nitrospirae bacterium 13_2_20CM_2_61_4]